MIAVPDSDVTYRLQGFCFETHNAIGVGFEEDVYHRGMERCLEKHAVEHRSGDKRAIEHRGRLIKLLELDLLVWNVILELKTILTDFGGIHFAQLLTYLKAWQLPLGLLVNFGLEEVKVKRVRFSEPERRTMADMRYLQGKLSASELATIEAIQGAAQSVLGIHGLGYGDLICRDLMLAELDHLGVPCRDELDVACRFGEEFIKQSRIDSFVVGGNCLVGVVALRDRTPYYNICKMRTHLAKMNLNAGLVVNFGKSALQINGVHVGWNPPK